MSDNHTQWGMDGHYQGPETSASPVDVVEQVEYEDWMNLSDRHLDEEHVRIKVLYEEQRTEARKPFKVYFDRMARKVNALMRSIGTTTYNINQSPITGGEIARIRTMMYELPDGPEREAYLDLSLRCIFGDEHGRILIEQHKEVQQ